MGYQLVKNKQNNFNFYAHEKTYTLKIEFDWKKINMLSLL